MIQKKDDCLRRLIRQKREKEKRRHILFGLLKVGLKDQTDPDQADILWEASSVSGLKVS